MTLSLVFKGGQSATQFYLAGAVSILFGLFSLTLPRTPPKKPGANVSLYAVLGLDALALMRKPSFAIFIACMFLICIPLYFYFVMMGIYLTELKWEGMAARMSLAQGADVIFLFLLPVFLKRFGCKITDLHRDPLLGAALLCPRAKCGRRRHGHAADLHRDFARRCGLRLPLHRRPSSRLDC